MAFLEGLELYNTKERRTLCGLLVAFTVLVVLFMVVGVLGLVYCTCDLKNQYSPVRSAEPIETAPSTELVINYTVSANCSQGVTLGNLIFVHVCWNDNDVLLDIRQFTPLKHTIKGVSIKPTIKGIGLKKYQWKKLKQVLTTIDQEIREKEFKHRIFKFSDWHV